MTLGDLIPTFLASCPAMKATWERRRESWGNAQSGTFNEMALIAHYVVECYEQGVTDELSAAFSLLERCLTEGDAQVKEATTIGIIEGIQNVASHRPFGLKAFEPWLKPRSRRAWDRVAAS
jgi:hypothetical protein